MDGKSVYRELKDIAERKGLDTSIFDNPSYADSAITYLQDSFDAVFEKGRFKGANKIAEQNIRLNFSGSQIE